MTASRLMLIAIVAGAAIASCAGPPSSQLALEPAPVLEEDGYEPRMPGPARGRMLSAVRDNDACVACHQDVAGSWRGSLHQRADIEPAYVRSFAVEPMPFCRSCHAPEADPAEVEPREVAELGVGCVTCHVTDGPAVLAAPRAAGQAGAERAPHPIERSARFATADACASCHEFRFPTARGHGPSSLMQSTITEHAASPARDRSCADCHMPSAAGKRSHSFAASRDPEVLRNAVSVAAERIDATRVRLTLTPIDPGHALPTGDLFRRLELSAEASGPDHMSLASASRYLTRHWGFKPTEMGRELKHDDRLTSGPASFVLDVGTEGAGREIVWRVAYQRVAHPNGVEEEHAEVEGEIVLASGALPPP